MIVKISVEGDPKTILFMGTENRLEFFFNRCSVEKVLAKNRLIIEEISEDEAKKTMYDMREFSTGTLIEDGKRPWST